MDEIAKARNIKNKGNRKAVTSALSKIRLAADGGYEGLTFYSDGEEIIIETYSGTEKTYYCGNEYVRPKPKTRENTLLVVADAQEATIGSTDGEHVTVIWSDTSPVPRKHRHGGQSQARFQRGRDEVLKAWLREVADMIITHSEGREIRVAGPGMTKNLLVEQLPVYVSNRISEVTSVGYTDENGLWELLGKSRYAEVH